MSKAKTPKTSKTSARTAKEPNYVYVPSAAEACDEAQYRLLVVQRMLLDHLDHCTHKPSHDNEDDGGYDVSIMVDALHDIRTLLQTSAEAADATPAAPADGGGAQ